MCTLILGLGILGPGSLLLGANRDESPERPSGDPSVLVDSPRVVGGRDLISRGTWLAVREGRFVAALMNRRPVPGDARDPASLRSRGLLCLDVAAYHLGHDSFLEAALDLVGRDTYAHCTLVGVGIDGEAWALRAGAGAGGGAGDGESRAVPIARGWHVITHMDLDDRAEPRTGWLLDALEREMPGSVDEGIALLTRLLHVHAADDAPTSGTPAVCIHRDIFPTVSSSIVALGVPGTARYLHAPGPPCVTEYQDCSALLGPPPR